MQDKHRNKAIKINVKSGNRLSPVDMIGNTALLYQTARGCTSSMILAICISLVMTISFILAFRFFVSSQFAFSTSNFNIKISVRF